MRNKGTFLSRLYPFLLWTLLVFLLLQSVPNHWKVLKRLECPCQVNQGEAVNVEYARLIHQKQTLYPDPTKGPYLFTAYPPTFFFLESLVSFTNPWLGGRFLAWAGYIGCAILLGAWGLKYWKRVETLLLVLLFLAGPTWAAWGSMVRVDTLMLFFHFSAFLALAMARQKEKSQENLTGLLVIAGLLEASAILLKQSAVSLVLIYGIYCFWKGKKKNFFLFGTIALMPFLTLGALLQVSTRGLYGLYIWKWVSFGYQWGALVQFFSGSFIPEAGWLLGGAILTWGFGRATTFTRLQFLMAFLWVLGMGRVTSAENYYLEFYLYGLYLLGEGWLARSKVQSLPKVPISFGGIALVGFLCLSLRPWPEAPSLELQAMKNRILPLYQKDGEYLSLDLDLPLMAGKKIWIQPAEYTALVNRGIWSTEPLQRDIREGRFSVIELYDIPQQYLLPRAVVDEVERNYQVWVKVFGRKWYIRR